MKKLYIYLQKGGNKPVSIPLLALAFIGGWILATWVFYFLGHGVRAAILSIFHGA